MNSNKKEIKKNNKKKEIKKNNKKKIITKNNNKKKTKIFKNQKNKKNNKNKKMQIETEPEKTLESLIKKNASLEQLFDHPDYLDETYIQATTLPTYLSSKQKITQLFDWIYNPEKISKTQNAEKNNKYAFYSYTTIANCIPEITKIIIKSSELMKKLFSVIDKNKNLSIDKNKNFSITSRGYFQMIIKNFLTDINPYLNHFIKVLKINPELYIFPLIQNLTKANSEIIKDILGTNDSKLKKLQLCVFEFLLYFYLNEKFASYDELLFENLVDIFHFLGKNEEVFYKYKLKYEFTLYSDDFVVNKKFSEPIYYLKLALLNYIAKTNQIKSCENCDFFLNSYKKFLKSKKILFYLKELLYFFMHLSKNREFEEKVGYEFVGSLFEIVDRFPFNDILHDIIFKIFENIKDFINKDKRAFSLTLNYILKQKKVLKFPNERAHNKVALFYIYQLLDNLNLDLIDEYNQKAKKTKKEYSKSPDSKPSKKENKKKIKKKHKKPEKPEKSLKTPLQTYLKSLQTLYQKLCFTEKSENFSEIEQYSEVEFALKKDFHLYKKGSQNIPDSTRFHYEDEIMKAEPIDTPELLKNTDLGQGKGLGKFGPFEDFGEMEFLPEKDPVDILNSFKEQSLLEGDLGLLSENGSGVRKENEIEHVLFSSEDEEG